MANKKFTELFTSSRSIYFIFLIIVLIDRFLLLQNFSFKFVGSDDTIFWQGTNDYLHGTFYEPYFYGQNYNFMLESVFAIPLVILNIPIYRALPISTCFITLFPFFLFSYILFKRGHVTEALLFVLIPLFLPIEYGILSSITRGFVSGLFFCSFLIFPVLNPTEKRSWVLAATMTAAGYIFNPNSLVFSFPVCIYMLLCNFKQLSFYFISLLSAFPILLIEYFSKQFYVKNSAYRMHHMLELQYSFNSIVKSIQELDKYFSYFSPLTWFAGWLILIIILLIGSALLKRKTKEGISLILGVVFIVFTLGVNKIHDHLDTIFLSSERMYLGIPLFAGLAFYWGRGLFPIKDSHFKTGLTGAVVCTFFIKASLLNLVIDHHTTQKNFGAVSIKKVNDLTCECQRIMDTVAAHPVDLVLFVSSWQPHLNVPVMEFLNYGCPVLQKKLPQTMMNIYERRTWVFEKTKSKVERNIMIYNSDIDFNIIRNMKNCEILSDRDPKMFIIKDNTLTLDSLFRFLKLDLTRIP